MFETAHDILRQAVADRAFSAAVIEVGTSSRLLCRDALGTLSYGAGAPRVDNRTVFDLASLTKVIATATVAMALVEGRRISLEDPLRRWLPEWSGHDREYVQVRDVLEHASGLPAYLPLFERIGGIAGFVDEIGRTPLEYVPRSRSVYSDLGFILLGEAFARAGGARFDQLTDRQLDRLRTGSNPIALRFNPPFSWQARTAATEQDTWRGRLLVGEVHDENAYALGGVAGHAGMFGTAGAVGAFAQAILRARLGFDDGERGLARPETVNVFTTRSEVTGSSRALAWDTMLPTSSCGSRLSAASFGHTGFTGTSLWIDPERDAYVVFLTNRVHPTRQDRRITAIRPALHDAIFESLDR